MSTSILHDSRSFSTTPCKSTIHKKYPSHLDFLLNAPLFKTRPLPLTDSPVACPSSLQTSIALWLLASIPTLLLTATAPALASLDSSVMLLAIDVPRSLANLAAAIRVATAPVPSVLDCSVTIDVLCPFG